MFVKHFINFSEDEIEVILSSLKYCKHRFTKHKKSGAHFLQKDKINKMIDGIETNLFNIDKWSERYSLTEIDKKLDEILLSEDL